MKTKNCISLRVISSIVIIVMVSAVTFSYSKFYSFANTTSSIEKLSNSVVLFLGSPKAYVNNKFTKIDDSNSSVKPINVQGRTLVPVRFIAENFGASVSWNPDTLTASISDSNTSIEITLGKKDLTVNGSLVSMDTAAISMGGRTFVPLRAVTEALGKELFWHNSGLIIVSNVKNIIDPIQNKTMLNEIIGSFAEPIVYEKREVSISTGEKTVQVITVNPKSPNISFEVNIPYGKLNTTKDFKTMVEDKGAFAAINGNFFQAYTDIKDPIGHVMSNGNLLFGENGFTSLGITKEKDLEVSMPGIFVRFYADGKKQNEYRRGPVKSYTYYNVWNAYEVNTPSQSSSSAILYTPARGNVVNIQAQGHILTVKNGLVESFVKATPPAEYTIPENGYVVFFGQSIVNSWIGDNGLSVGRKIDYEYFLVNNTDDEFKIEDMKWMVSGGPDLVINSKLAPDSTQRAFSGDRFTKISAPRTAIGVTEANHLLMVSVSGATIGEMREIMLALGSQSAINLDGGGSTAMYYDGKVMARPGRKLTTILYIYKDTHP